ncbi:MAG TPA: sigma 54-interacting transcriptional regulator [Bryobacteraceae bacterium]|nr:sigma 54-interacting transcriptional regulator [Bryobacteraceae bacterium]
MNPCLVAIEGPLTGHTFSLPDGDWTIGRGAQNHLDLPDKGCSRNQCVIKRSGRAMEVVDLNSHNGTLVNGQKITEHELADNDRLQIGASVFVFHDGDDQSALDSSLTYHTIDLNTSEFFSDAGLEDLDLDQVLQSNQNLRLLMRVSTLLHSFRALHDAQNTEAQTSLARHVIGLFMEILPAESGRVLAASPDPAAPYVVLAQAGNPFEADAALVARLSTERIAILLSDEVTSTLAAPIISRNEIEAILYFTASGRKVFRDQHLQLLTALAGMAGIAWENAAMIEWLHAENDLLREQVRVEHGMIGGSARLKDLQKQISRVAPSNSTVLILGESGTGKELIARAIHRNSPRSAGPFVAINCAALTDTLLESELFGYEKGAFTGAVSQRKGKLETAQGGTVFLDEIGELSPLLQAKLLRVLQERELQRVGGTENIKLDIRVIAATNRDLAEAAGKGAFRPDLYYRLNVVTLMAAPLRQRPEDILPLAEHFAKKFSQQCGRRIAGISPQAKAYLQSHSWPGNVRELENAIERAVVLGVEETILPEDLPETVREERHGEISATLYEEAVENAKKQVVLRAFEQAGYEHDRAAKLLGLHPNYLHRLIRALDIREDLKSARSR